MNRDQRPRRWNPRWTGVMVSVAAMVAAVAAGDPPKPRVLVILDTSRSMRELPVGSLDTVIPVDPAAGGDYDPTINNACVSKFCSAKKVIYDTIPNFSGDARIGLTTYYQYVLNIQLNSTETTTCSYDVLSPADAVRTYTSFIDFTGSGSTVCPGGPSDPMCAGSTRSFVMPDSSVTAAGATTSGALRDSSTNRCAAPAGYTSPTDPTLTFSSFCSSGARNCYQVTKTAAAGGYDMTRDTFRWPIPSLPTTIPATGAVRYTSENTALRQLIGNGATRIRRRINFTDTTCTGSDVVMPTTTPPSTGSASIQISSITAGSAANGTISTSAGPYYANSTPITCSSTEQCNVFLHSSTPVGDVNTTRTWYGFFNNTFTPSPTYAGTTSPTTRPYTYSQNTGVGTWVTNALVGTEDILATSSCSRNTNRYTSGNLNTNFFIAVPTLTNPALSLMGDNDTPNLSGGNYNCTPEWPCDMVKTESTYTPSDVNSGQIYNNNSAVLTSMEYTTAGSPSSQSYSIRATDPSETTCPNATLIENSVNNATSLPTNYVWHSSMPPGCTSSGKFKCSLSLSLPAGTVTGSCPTQYTYSSSATPSPTKCAFNGQTYTSGATTSMSVTRQLDFGSSCPSSPGTIASASDGTAAGAADDYSGCGGYPCQLAAAPTLQTAGSIETSAWTNSNMPPIGYSGSPTASQYSGSSYVKTWSSSSTGSCSSGEMPGTSSTCFSGSSCWVENQGYQASSQSFGCDSSSPMQAPLDSPSNSAWTNAGPSSPPGGFSGAPNTSQTVGGPTYGSYSANSSGSCASGEGTGSGAQCSGGGSCWVANLGYQQASAFGCDSNTALTQAPLASPESSGWLNTTTPPAGYSGTPTTQTVGDIAYPPNLSAETMGACPAGDLQATDASVCGSNTSCLSSVCAGGSSCLVRSNGWTQVSPSGCGAENKPCYQCQYQRVQYSWTRRSQPCFACATQQKQYQWQNRNQRCYGCQYRQKQYQWSRNKVLCNYVNTRTTWNVSTANTLLCTYTRPQYTLWTRQAERRLCTYTVPAVRITFNQPTQKFCEYWALRSTLVSPRTLYTYQYLTKGTELIGRAARSNASGGGKLCSNTYTTGSGLQSLCPEIIAGCTGTVSTTTNSFMTPPAGATCRLRWGGNTDSNNVGALTGRWTSYLSTGLALNQTQACEADNTSLPASPESYKSNLGSPMGFCAEGGSPASTTRRLVSDFYSPTTPTSTANYTASLYPTGTYTLTSNNSTMKVQGFGGKAGTPAVGTGALDHASLFIPVPPDSVNANDQKAMLQAAMGKCVYPNTTAPDATGRLAGGACISDYQNADAPGVSGVTCSNTISGRPPGFWCSNNIYKTCTSREECWPWQDFTPLYGSLKNAQQYLNSRWTDDDPQGQCRDYYIILATDGAESTPAGYLVNGSNAATSIEGLVASFRETAVPRTKPDVKTFVIAFGQGIASLDAVAAAGGTNQAFSASNAAQLQTALQAVFTTITRGVYARSRPALSTDGSRLYAAQYIRSTNSPEWSGRLTAYRVALDGSFFPAWEMGDKLDDPAHPARDISVGLRRTSDNQRVVGPFLSSNSELTAQLSLSADFPSAPPTSMTSSQVIDFLRAAGESYAGTNQTQFVRIGVLGPIVSSSPVVVSKSPFDLAWGGSSGAPQEAYAAYIADSASRPTRVLFQANDGMLHAANEGNTTSACAGAAEASITCPNGQEAWAFVPGSLYRSATQGTLVNSLYKLKLGAWADNLLDGILSVSDVCGTGADLFATGCNAKSHWKTIAIGTQRNGGRGMYAVDVSTGLAPNNTSAWLWDFSDGNLGLTYSTPAIGRVKARGEDIFIAYFGGGDDVVEVPGTQGAQVYALHALTGELVRGFSSFSRGAATVAMTDPVVARPATWRRPGQSYLDSAFIGAGRALLVSRFAQPVGSGGAQHNAGAAWQPAEFFDPTSSRNTIRPSGGTAQVRRVVETAGTPPTYTLATVTSLPVVTNPFDTDINNTIPPPPILNRPKMGAVLTSSGAVPDLYVGTGDVRSPETPAPEFSKGNYFYAIHDRNTQDTASTNDGQPMWVMRFPLKEQVVSEPAIIDGCIIVATYTPPTITAGCGAVGDTTLYGFDPLTGDLKSCLVYPAGQSYAGTSTPVVRYQGAGIPSDLVVVNNNVFISTSETGVQRAPVRQVPQSSQIRSFRRVR